MVIIYGLKLFDKKFVNIVIVMVMFWNCVAVAVSKYCKNHLQLKSLKAFNQLQSNLLDIEAPESTTVEILPSSRAL